jgi:hypothetical protein
MILQAEIKEYIKAKFSTMVLQLVPPNFDGTSGILLMPITLDFMKIWKQKSEIGLFIVGNYQ